MLKVTGSPSSLALQLFEPGQAGIAILLLDMFVNQSGAKDLSSSLVHWIEPGFSKYSDEVIEKATNAGLIDTELAVTILGEWQKEMLRQIEDGRVVVQRVGYDPINIGSAYHDGNLFYPIQTLVTRTINDLSGTISTTENIDIVVVRSDRSLLKITESSDARGKLSGIVRLDDGTLLQKKPSTSPHATWSWASVQSYLEGNYRSQHISTLALMVYRHLHKSVWLPEENDYWLLTCTTICSYVQAIFDAVPLILLSGKGGTGKSQLGMAIAEVSCNAVMIGNVSPGTMMRLMDEARGLVVIDDLESIGGKDSSSGKERFGEMIQTLKQSYKKSSATKIVTNTRRQTEVMNFFGVKVVSNTTGVDAILGSRMLHIHTKNIPKDQIDSFLARDDGSESGLKELRNALHIWAFDNASSVNSMYREVISSSSERENEIAAPLRAIARLIGIEAVQVSLESSLLNQGARKSSHASPDDALVSIMSEIVKSGRKEISIAEISLTLRAEMNQPMRKKDTQVWMKPEWISRKIRDLGYVEGEGRRVKVFGYQMRIVEISMPKKIELGTHEISDVLPSDFCGGCKNCPFKNFGCEIMPYRLKKEGVIS